MDQLKQSSHYFDLASLDNLRQQAQTDPNASLKQVAQQFEGIFMGMMLQSMRDANEGFKDQDSPFNSQNTQFYQQMHDSQMSNELSSQGSLGLADLIVAQLGGGDGLTPASLLSGDRQFVPLASGEGVAPMAANAAENHTITPTPMASAAADNRALLAARASDEQPSARTQPSPRQQETLVAPMPLSAEVAIETKPLVFTQPDEFVQALLPAATDAANKLNQDPHLLIAQAALETGWGRKILPGNQGQSSHNLFNIKADNRWGGEKTSVSALEFEDNMPTMKRSSFRVYDDLKASFDDYVEFLQQPRYREALNASDASGFATGLQRGGYATDPQYASKVLDVFQRLLQQRLNP
ncbi:flagellar assembly peptidoglycan hydrolase FlgJ [uncultured Ferrimonas sp.]|uniref:flagellar assembly peptidoglycan hydrolase FlgJ n=1 Tax=uncultured Ferrimonas sp. TaxID=432640 RepID=UPI00260D2D60|nr:flagellar assembly peptidoglycan hydrolase FlgJ [uncultured Ferrimonas sp.]